METTLQLLARERRIEFDIEDRSATQQPIIVTLDRKRPARCLFQRAQQAGAVATPQSIRDPAPRYRPDEDADPSEHRAEHDESTDRERHQACARRPTTAREQQPIE